MRSLFEAMYYFIYALCCLLALSVPMTMVGQTGQEFRWEKLPALPDTMGRSGMYCGVSHGVLLAMGGRQHQDRGVARDSSWSDRIYVLTADNTSWQIADERLPFPMANGLSVSYMDRILLVGGIGGGQYLRQVFDVRYIGGQIVIDTLVSLPFPMAYAAGAIVGDVLYVAGGRQQPDKVDEKIFLALDLSGRTAKDEWVLLETWPGPPRRQAISASLGNRFFLFGGFGTDTTAKKTGVRRDAYQFDPHFENGKIVGGIWKALADMPTGVAGGPVPAPTAGSDHILFTGGIVSGNAGEDEGPQRFVQDLLAYHVKSNTWVNFGKIPEEERRYDLSVVKWQNQWVMVGGKRSSDDLSPTVNSFNRHASFGWVNWITLLVYLIFMVWIGYRFHHQDQTTANFFTVSGKIPWWAAGISLFGAQISAITYMATPAIVYATDWSLAIGSVMILFTVPFVIKYYIPFFRRLSITSAYEYLEHRFNGNVRLIGSLSFILFQLGRIGIVLFLPAIAVSSVTQIDVYLLITVMGVICVFYAVAGGMEAVIWTDVVQVVVLMGGAILCLVVATNSIDGGLQGVIQKGMEAEKFKLFHLSWDYSKPVLWVCIVGFFFLDIIPYTSDQTLVQRYLTVKDEKAAAKSLWTNAFIVLPSIVIFFGIGTVLYVFYVDNPTAIPSEKVGEILPYFIVQELPSGIAGLVVAGIFAASQSALGAGMNSVSAAYVTDIHPHLRRVRSDRENLRTARIATIVVGLVGIGSAMLVAWLNVEFLFIFFMELLGILGGALAGVFFLGIFTTRATSGGVIIGVLMGMVAVWLAKGYTEMNSYLYGAVSVMATVIGGYLASMFTQQSKSLDNLTYFTKVKEEG